jgi:Xaa-Pro dipeptidase
MINLRQLTFTPQEYERRVDSLRQRMNERNLDAVMINDPANIAYLTGHFTTGYGTFQALIISHDLAWMVTRLLEESNVITRTWVDLTRPYLDTQDPLEVTINSFSEFNFRGKSLGIETRCFFLPQHFQQQMKESCSNFTIEDCTGIVEQGRIIKSDQELSFMQDIADITQKSMVAGQEAVAAGANEDDISATIHHAMYRAGGQYPAVAPYITSGPRTLIGHATWEGRTIKEGDCVFIELAGCKKRYHTAMMRTLFVGDPPKELLIAEKLVKEALAECMKAMKPGVPVENIDKLSREILSKNSINATQITRSGYSIGIAFAPSWDEGHILSLREGEKTLLEENMTFHLIPWIQLPEQFMVMGLSETVYITPEGAKSFFDLPPNLIVK